MTNLPRTEIMLRHIDRCRVCFCQENLEISDSFFVKKI